MVYGDGVDNLAGPGVQVVYNPRTWVNCLPYPAWPEEYRPRALSSSV